MAVASSSTRMAGFFNRVRANDRRCRWPPESFNALVADDRVVSIGQFLDECACPGGFCRFFQFFLPGQRTAVSNVFRHGAVQQQRILGHQADLIAKTLQADITDIFAIDPDTTPARGR